MGSWKATEETEGAKDIGGAGQTYVFSANRTAVQSYNGSSPLVNQTYRGTASANYVLTPNSSTATSGSITLSYVTGDITATSNGSTVKLPLASATFEWTCNSTTAVLSAATAAGTIAVDITRQ